MRRYDGTLDSLRDKSKKPHHHPNEHTKEEIKLIKDMYAKNAKEDICEIYQVYIE